jgi:hypothetical protein
MKKSSAFGVIALVVVSACSSTPTDLGSEGTAYINQYGSSLTTTAYRFDLEDGTPVWGVDCSGPGLNFGHCHQRAKHLCVHGYTLKGQSSSDGGAAAVVTQQIGSGARSVDRTITIACKEGE